MLAAQRGFVNTQMRPDVLRKNTPAFGISSFSRVILYLPTKTIPNKKSRPKTGSAFLRSPGYVLPTFSKRRLSTLPLLRSTIDVVGLNFSVRNGKRWIPNAITTLIPFIANSKIFDRTTASRNETKTSKELTPSDVLTKYQT